MKLKKWGKMSWGKMSSGEKCRTCANFEKKWGKMSFGEKRRREKCHGEKCNLGKNVLHPITHLHLQPCSNKEKNSLWPLLILDVDS